MLTLATATYKRYDLLAKMIESAEAGTRRPDRYFFVDNGRVAKAECLPPNTTICSPGTNIGVAAAVNLIYRESPDLTIWTNDDVTFEADTLEKLERAALEDPTRLFILPRHNVGSAFTVFLARRALFERVGWFDERFWPAYYEDNDFAYRMQLAGIPYFYADCHYEHRTSATIAIYSNEERADFNKCFDANKALYVKKWGGEPGQEKWTEPHE